MKVDLDKLAEWLLKVFVVAFVLCILFLMLISCAAPKTVAEQQHHRSEADSLAVQAVVDSRLQAVREQMEREVYVALATQQTELDQQEQEKERVTETITTWVDSLGRAFRQEQRTTERDISRQQQQREQRMQQEYEQRLLTAVDSLNAAWQAQFEEVKGHWEQEDSTANTVTPVAEDNRPWYKRWWEAVRWMLAGAVVFAVLWWTRKFWLPLLRTII